MKKVYEFTTQREKTINDFIEAVASDNYSHIRFSDGWARIYHLDPKSPTGVVWSFSWHYSTHEDYKKIRGILEQYDRRY
jgi:hypothetical protein